MNPKSVKFLNEPKLSTHHKWVKTWKTLWLLPVVRPNYRLEENMFIELTFEDDSKEVQCILKGYECDLGSLPSILWSLWLPDSIELEAIKHDIDYQSESFERSVCDKFLKLAMQVRKKPKTIVTLFYTAVKYFGWNVWRKHTKESIKSAKKYVMFYILEKDETYKIFYNEFVRTEKEQK